LMIAASGVGWVYIANAISFAFVIVALLMMRNVPARSPSEGGSRDDVSLHAALEGLRFVFRSPLIRSTMLLDFFATFFSSATALLPIFAQDILRVGAQGYGWLYAAPAVGAVAMSAAMIPLTNRIERRGPVLLWVVGGCGLRTGVVGSLRLRPRDGGVWTLHVVLAYVRVPGDDRCDGHHQHDHTEHRAAAR